MIASRSVSATSRPSVFTTSAPSIDSCATAETSPIRSCARRAGPCIRTAKLRFITARAGNRTAAIIARKMSAAIGWIIARTISTITPVANGTGQKTSTAAFTSASMREELTGGGLAVVRQREPPVPVGDPRAERGHHALAGHAAEEPPKHDPRARRQPNVINATTASQIFRGSTPPENAGCNTSSVARPRVVVRAIEANANKTAPRRK